MANPFDKAKEAADKAKALAEGAADAAKDRLGDSVDVAKEATVDKVAGAGDEAKAVVAGAGDGVAGAGDAAKGATITGATAASAPAATETTQQVVSTISSKKVVEKVGVGRRAALWPLLLLAPIGLGVGLFGARGNDKNTESASTTKVAVATDAVSDTGVASGTEEVVMTEASATELVGSTDALAAKAGAAAATDTAQAKAGAAATTEAATTIAATTTAPTTTATSATAAASPTTEAAPAAASEAAVGSVKPLPLVVGQAEGAGRAALESAGLLVVINQKSVSNPAEVGKVIEQTPKTGDLVKGSTITLVIGVEEGSDTSAATNEEAGIAVPKDGVVNLTG